MQATTSVGPTSCAPERPPRKWGDPPAKLEQHWDFVQTAPAGRSPSHCGALLDASPTCSGLGPPPCAVRADAALDISDGHSPTAGLSPTLRRYPVGLESARFDDAALFQPWHNRQEAGKPPATTTSSGFHPARLVLARFRATARASSTLRADEGSPARRRCRKELRWRGDSGTFKISGIAGV